MPIVARALVLALGLVVLGGADARAEDAKQACVAAHADAQRLRTEGKLKEAHEKLLYCVKPECPNLARTDCSEWLAQVQEDLPSLIIVATDTNGNDVLDVRVLEGQRVLADRLTGQPIFIDPGPHTLRFERNGATAVRKFVLRVGERNRRLEVQFSPELAGDEGTASATEPVQPEPEKPEGGGGRPIPVASWILGGVGVVGLAGFVVFSVDGRTREKKLEVCKPSCDPDHVQAARRSYLIGDISLGVGVVALAGATYFYLSSRGAPEAKPAARLRIDILPTRGGAAAGVVGRF